MVGRRIEPTAAFARLSEPRPHAGRSQSRRVIFALFGFNESFAGPAKVVKKFEADLASFLKKPYAIDQYKSARGGWDSTPEKAVEPGAVDTIRQIVLVSPIAHENVEPPRLSRWNGKNNENLEALHRGHGPRGRRRRQSGRSSTCSTPSLAKLMQATAGAQEADHQRHPSERRRATWPVAAD